MKKHSLAATVRTLLGRKVKNLRKDGQIPATVYGKGVKSASLVVAASAFTKVYKEAGETGLIELHVGNDTRPVLVHTVQIDPVSDEVLHVEFHQVDLKEKVHAKVSIVHIGEAAAVAQKLGVLLTVLDEIEVEALPTDLPEKITVDVTNLANVDDEVKVGDIHVSSGVTVLTDPGLTVIKVGALVTKEAEAQAAAEEAEATQAAVVSGEPAEGQVSEAEAKPEDSNTSQ